MAKNKIGTCVFCGKNGPITDDHIPPKNLFHGFPDKDLIKVPSCNSCNNGTKKDDEYFRAFLVPQAGVAKHHQAKKLNEHIRKGFDENQRKGLEKRMDSQLHYQRVITPAGIDLGVQPILYPEYERIDRILKKIVRGMCAHVTGFPLPPRIRIAVVDLLQIHDLERFLGLRLEDWARSLATIQPIDIQGVFIYRYCFSPPISAWELDFFSHRKFFAITYPDHLGPEHTLQDPDPNEVGFVGL